MTEPEQPISNTKLAVNVVTVLVLVGIGAYMIYYLFQS
jgi:hypothetical protein